MDDLAIAYRAARVRVGALVGAATPEQLARVVPATPLWTVHEVVCHLSGVAADAVSGRMDGAPGDAWTERHVAERRALPTAEVLAEWNEDAPALEARDSLPFPLIADIASHEQDLRAALGVPGARDNDAIALVFPLLAQRFTGRVAEAGLPGVRIVTEAGSIGPEDAPATLTGTRFDLLRAMTGRRSEAQVRALDWSVDPAPYLGLVSIFPFPTDDLVE